MKFDEMNAEQLEARLEELKAETSAEKRDALSNDDLEARINEMEAIQGELEARRRRAAAERRGCPGEGQAHHQGGTENVRHQNSRIP